MNISRELLEEILKTSLSRGGDYADIFIEHSTSTAVHWDAGALRNVHAGLMAGAGIRIIIGGNYVYLYTSNPDARRLRELAREAAQAISSECTGTYQSLNDTPSSASFPIEQYPDDVPLEEKIDILKRADASAREYSQNIRDVLVYYQDKDQQITIAGSDGRFIQDRRVRTRLGVTSIAASGDKRERGFFGPGMAMGMEFFDRYPPEDTARESSRIACTLLDADNPPQGAFPVIIANELGGVIFHEACGHALEAANVAKGASVFQDRLNKPIASGKVNAFDDGAIDHGWGSSCYDDEGEPVKRTQLIKRGRLLSFMTDRLNAQKLGVPVTGNGRRESYQFAPTSRMSNTYIAAGKKSFEEMISSLDTGLYCRRLGGGSVHAATSEFNFSVMEAYLIKNGAIDRPVKGASLIGKGSEVLRRIEMVGNDLSHGTGMCGSISGSIPAGIGQPTILVRELVVGGRS